MISLSNSVIIGLCFYIKGCFFNDNTRSIDSRFVSLIGLSENFLVKSLQNLRDLMGYVQAYLKKPKGKDRVTSLGVRNQSGVRVIVF